MDEFQHEVLKALESMGDEEPVPTDYLATRLEAGVKAVEAALRSLSDTGLVEAETDVAEITRGPAPAAKHLHWRITDAGREAIAST